MPIMKGSGKEVGELPPVKCTYHDCVQHFATQKEMKRHKLDDAEHNYCKKCDVDCDDWESLVQHKIDAMSPWLEGKMTQYARDSAAPEDDKSKLPAPKHIVCEFCGADFKSFGGRKSHRAREHVADQSITCPGCGAYFIRAAMLVQHLEDALCNVITRQEFYGSIRQKHFLKAIFKAPDEYLTALQMNKTLPLGIEVASQGALLAIGDLSLNNDDDAEEGGTSVLLDQDDPAQKAGYKPMTPNKFEADLIDFEDNSTTGGSGQYGSYSRAIHETWPRLPGLPATSFLKESRSTPTDASNTLVNEDKENGDSEITSRRGGVKVKTASFASRHSAATMDSSPVRNITSTKTNIKEEKNAWSDGKLSQKLTKRNLQTLPRTKAGDWSGFTRHKEDAVQDHKKGNLLYSHWWDPRSEDYSVDRFLAYVEVPKLDSRTGKMIVDSKTDKPIIESIVWKYCCPDPDCKARFDRPEDFETHWVYGHGQLQWRCPCCLKLFKTVASLIRHCESNSKCGVKYSDQFQMLISDITGGFLKTKRCEEPRIFRQDKALIVAGEAPIYGLMPVEYAAKMPGDQ